MHKAVCDECHKSCEVPFRPSGDKPIYCSDCFSSKRDDGDRAPRREFNDRPAPRREFNDRPAPRREFNDRPAPSFNKPAAPANDDVKRQLSEMNSKLDRLINSIEKLAQPKTAVAQVVAKPVVKVAPAVVKAPIKKVVAAKAPAKKVVAKKGKK
jgi:CxxC-x17-CxxC domain-containing protein